MKWLDGYLRRARFNMAHTCLMPGKRLLDIGTFDGGIFFHRMDKALFGIGIDPCLDKKVSREGTNYTLIEDRFPSSILEGEAFDQITALAVMEHIPLDAQPDFVQSCHALLNPGGRVILTVPSPLVDYLLVILRFFRLMEGIKFEEHYGFNPTTLFALFEENGFNVFKHKRFQLGLNNLFVFEKRG